MRNMPVKSLESLARYAHTVFSMPIRINLRPMRASNGLALRGFAPSPQQDYRNFGK